MLAAVSLKYRLKYPTVCPPPSFTFSVAIQKEFYITGVGLLD